MSENLIRHTHPIGKTDRLKNNGHQAKVIWLVGLSGSGKSTLAGNVETVLHQKGYKTYLLDGDNVRLGLNNDLGFSSEGSDREPSPDCRSGSVVQRGRYHCLVRFYFSACI